VNVVPSESRISAVKRLEASSPEEEATSTNSSNVSHFEADMKTEEVFVGVRALVVDTDVSHRGEPDAHPGVGHPLSQRVADSMCQTLPLAPHELARI